MDRKEIEKWEKEVEALEKENKMSLSKFEEWLRKSGLKPKTINTHILNMDLYLNDYLLRYDPITAENGATEIDSFLGDFFIRKVSWASKYTIQENIASFKKFYTFFNQIGKTSNEDLAEMKKIIKKEKANWIQEVDDYWNRMEEDFDLF